MLAVVEAPDVEAAIALAAGAGAVSVWARDRGFSRYGNTDRHPTDGWTTNSQWGQFYGVKGGPGCTKAAGCDYALNRGSDPTNPAR